MLHHLESALIFLVCLGIPWDKTDGGTSEQAILPATSQHAATSRLPTLPFAQPAWSSWSVCEGQRQTRMRTCSRRRKDGSGAYEVGLCVQSRSCRLRTKGIEMWTEWGQWSECDAKGPEAVRVRKCVKSQDQSSPNFQYQYSSSHWLNIAGCFGPAYQTKPCSHEDLTKSGWSEWQAWSSCVGNQRRRVRVCHWSKCVGGSLMTETCKQGNTDVVTPKPEDRILISQWLEWGAWSECNEFLQTRQRECSGDACTGFRTESKACGSRSDSVSDAWSGWSSWSSCRLDVEMRSRFCIEGGRCVGAAYQQRACSTGGQGYAMWAPWSQCVSGKQSRIRRCRVNDLTCEVKGFQVRPCSSNTDGDRNGEFPMSGWTHWSQWSKCVGGLRTRNRKCISEMCRGYSDEVQNCPAVTKRPLLPSVPPSTPRYVETSGWGEWGPWETGCSYGKQWRRRTCVQDWQSRTADCIGPSSKSRPCIYY